ncbi:DUF4962 domain-containing protein, partial [Massilia sp. YIM B04103]|uniref:DUF4962 domain-containing protein n=1 Tax=Massilia sp. YIM B04103 TaxID=2963106 RepID=UPI00210942E1
MNLPKLSALLIACGLVAGTPLARADWAQSADPLVVAAKPGSYQTQVQNPPTFSWARHPTGSGSYTLEIRQGATVVRSYTTDRTWYLPSTLLPNGNYTWRVRPASATDWSSERQFSISAVSKPFLVPENAALRTAVLARPRPRGLPTSVPAVSAWSAAMKAERGNALQGLSNEVLLQTGKLALSKDANWGLTASQPATAAFVQQQTSVRTQINLSGRQLEAAALLYRLTGDVRFLAEALRRGDELAALDPFGPTSYINQDQATRVIALSLSKALDYLGAALDAQRRTLWRDVIAARTGEIYKDLADANMRFDQLPYDSLRSTNLGYLTIIAALTLGDIPAATTWFDFSVRGYAASLMVWSGQEGGYSNGTAYAEYAADYALQIWPPLMQATGINLFNKPWSQGFLTFLMQFVPPGSKNHLFGDGQETAPEFRFMKAFASRFATPEAAWYARNLSGNEDNLTMLQAAYPLPQSSVTTAAPPANSAFFPGIGWAAMHSKMADLTRT